MEADLYIFCNLSETLLVWALRDCRINLWLLELILESLEKISMYESVCKHVISSLLIGFNYEYNIFGVSLKRTMIYRSSPRSEGSKLQSGHNLVS